MSWEMVEVRCCCDGHLVGWMPPGPYEVGKSYRWALLADPDDWFHCHDGERITATLDTLTLECDIVTLHKGTSVERSYPALKSRDYPIELLRRLSGFKEYTGSPGR